MSGTYPNPDCGTCHGSGTLRTCKECFRNYNQRYNGKTKVCDCGAPKHVKADRCRECYNKDRINENKHWEVHYARIDNARKKKLLKMLNASSSDVIKSSTIVYCYYHRPTRKNFLAWRHGDVSKWLKENGLERNDYIKTVCALSEVNINLTGIDLSEYTTLGQTG